MLVSENLIIDFSGVAHAWNRDEFDLLCLLPATESQTNYRSPVRQILNFFVLLLLLSEYSFPLYEVKTGISTKLYI